jgi:hypothetical protein
MAMQKFARLLVLSIKTAGKEGSLGSGLKTESKTE